MYRWACILASLILTAILVRGHVVSNAILSAVESVRDEYVGVYGWLELCCLELLIECNAVLDKSMGAVVMPLCEIGLSILVDHTEVLTVL